MTRPVGCGMDVTPSFKFKLGELEPLVYKSYSFAMLKSRRNVADSLPETTPEILTNRIICLLALEEAVFCINFIPADPYQTHTMQVIRMKSSNKDAASYPVYYFDLPGLKFLLPRKRADAVFDLSQLTIAQCTMEPRPAIEKALSHLLQDARLKGLALTLDNDGIQKTYIWLK